MTLIHAAASESGALCRSLDEKGVLTFTGTGEIPGHHSGSEWETIRETVREIHIREGITAIDTGAFRDFRKLEKVFLPGSMKQIQAYAFRDCISLSVVESCGKSFRYFYDSTETDTDDEIIFGLQAFHNTPWSNKNWGDFYISDDRLYIAFPGNTRLSVPEGVRVLAKFSVNDLSLDALALPESLEAIEDFVFSRSCVQERVSLPEAAADLAPYALADCSLNWDISSRLLEEHRRCLKMDEKARIRFPQLIQNYSLVRSSKGQYGGFYPLFVKKKRSKAQPDRKFRSFIIDDFPDVGESLLRRIKLGTILLCIEYENNRVRSVKSFSFNKTQAATKEYLMYPVQDDRHRLDIWRDSFTWQEDAAILYAFPYEEGSLLAEKGLLRMRDREIHEEWFCSNDVWDFGGPLEIRFLNNWLCAHPEMTVYSAGENQARDPHRNFVRI